MDDAPAPLLGDAFFKLLEGSAETAREYAAAKEDAETEKRCRPQLADSFRRWTSRAIQFARDDSRFVYP